MIVQLILNLLNRTTREGAGGPVFHLGPENFNFITFVKRPELDAICRELGLWKSLKPEIFDQGSNRNGERCCRLRNSAART